MSEDSSGRRWSPFPVQDWDSLPYDPMVVSPAWAPPTPPRPGWLPLTVCLLVAALVAGGVLWSERLGLPAADRGAVLFVPADGAAQFVDRRVQQATTTTTDTTTTSTAVTESARLYASAGISGLDFTFGARMLGATGVEELPSTAFWRTTTTEVGSLESSQQTVRLYRINEAVELLGESAPGRGRVYVPALVELPADVRPGTSWSGSGSASDTLTYSSSMRAEEAAGGCLLVSGDILLATLAGQVGEVIRVAKTWCPQRGVVTRVETRPDTTTTETQVKAAPPGSELRTVSEPWPWTAPAAWRRRAFDVISADATFGEQIMSGTPSSVPPAVAASGLVLRVVQQSNDVVAFTARTQDRWLSLWRMHPGGVILTLTTFGDVVVVTTSRREVVGYSDAGVRLWQFSTDELVSSQPVRISDRELVLCDVGGAVAVTDLASGARRWQQRVGSDVAVPPVVGAGLVVIMDRSETQTAYGIGSGEQRWRRNRYAVAGAISQGQLVSIGDETAEGVSLEDGSLLWRQVVDGTFRHVVGTPNAVLVASDSGTLRLDSAGRVLERYPAYPQITVSEDQVVGWAARRADVRDRDGRLLSTWELPALTVAGARLPLAYRHGVWLFDNNSWKFESWSDEP